MIPAVVPDETVKVPVGMTVRTVWPTFAVPPMVMVLLALFEILPIGLATPLAELATDAPIALVALTVKVYDVQLVRPVTTQLTAPVVVQVFAPGAEVTV